MDDLLCVDIMFAHIGLSMLNGFYYVSNVSLCLLDYYETYVSIVCYMILCVMSIGNCKLKDCIILKRVLSPIF
jgi:hypothetical protein